VREYRPSWWDIELREYRPSWWDIEVREYRPSWWDIELREYRPSWWDIELREYRPSWWDIELRVYRPSWWDWLQRLSSRCSNWQRCQMCPVRYRCAADYRPPRRLFARRPLEGQWWGGGAISLNDNIPGGGDEGHMDTNGTHRSFETLVKGRP